MKKRGLLVLPLVLFAALGISSCSNDKKGEDTGEVIENLSGIRLDYSNVKINYVVGESFSAEGLKVYAEYIDGTEKEVTNYTIDESTFDSSKRGDYFIKVIYTEKNVTKTKTYRTGVTSILDNVNYIVGIQASGAKSEYAYQDNLDLSGLEVKAIYKDGTSKALSSSEYSINTSAFDSSKRGNYEIILSYEETYTSGTNSEKVEVETCFFASVILNMTSIKVTGTSTFYQYEKLDLSDWKVTISFEEGISEEIKLGFSTDMFDIFENSNLASGYKKITVSYTYNGKTATVEKSCRILGVDSEFNVGSQEVGSLVNTTNVIDDMFTIMPGYQIVSDSVECDDQLLSKALIFNSTGSRTEKSIKLTLKAGAKIDVVASSDEGATFGIYDEEGNPITVVDAGSSAKRYSFEVPSSGTYYIWGSTTFNIYYIGIWNK